MTTGIYRVNEIFDSVQGEGYTTGRWCTFIRLQGCTVGCEWCDTKYTWGKGGTEMDAEDILEKVTSHTVVITGGEPLLWDLDPLIWRLRDDRKRFVILETSGQEYYKGILKADYLVWSPKEKLKYSCPGAFYKIADEVKWVVDKALEYKDVWSVWTSFVPARPTRSMPIFSFMPEGCPPRIGFVHKALEFIQRAGLPQWRYSDRIQYRIGVK